VRFHRQIYSRPLLRRLVAQTASATETSTSKPIIVVFLVGQKAFPLCRCEQRGDEATSWAQLDCHASPAITTYPYLHSYGRRYRRKSISASRSRHWSACSSCLRRHGNHGTAGLESYRVPHASGGLDNKHPVTYIALPPAVLSHGDHCAVQLNPHRVPKASADLDDICPVTDIALPIFVPSGGDNGAVRL